MNTFLEEVWNRGMFVLVILVGILLASVTVHADDEIYTTDDFTLIMEGGTKYVPSGTGTVEGNFTFKKSKLAIKEFNLSGSTINSVINLAYKGIGSGGIAEILVEETNTVVDIAYQTAYTWLNHGNGTIEPTSPVLVNATKVTSYQKVMKPLSQAKLQFKDGISIPIKLSVKDLQKDKEINWTANLTFTYGSKIYSFKIDPMFNTTTTNRMGFSTNTTGLSAPVYNVTCPINGTSGASFGGSVVSNIWGMCQSINGTSFIYYSSGGTDINEVNGSDNERFSTKTEWGVAQNFTIGTSFFPSYVNDSTYFRKSGANLVSEFSSDTCAPVSGTPVQIQNYPNLIGFSINQTSGNTGFLCDNNDFSVTGSNFYFETIFMPTNLGAHGNGKRLLHKWSSTDSYWFGVSGSGSAKILGANLVIGSSGITVETTEDMNNYEVYHVVATFDGTTLRLFVNGILNKTAAYGTVKSMPFVSGVSCIGMDILDGSSCNSGNWLPAQLGELEVGEKNLSQDEITTRYRSKMQASFWTWGIEESTAGGATNKEPNSTIASVTSVLYKNTTANFSSLYTDDDLHIGILNFRIWRNSVYLENISRYDIPNGTNISISYVLATSFSHFDNITVETYANDNTTNSSYKNSTVFQLRDVMPSATLSWTPGSISSGSTLNISSLYNDFDTDNATIRFYIYKNAVETVNINRTSVANNTNVSVTSSPSMVNGDNISYLINASSLAESVKLSSTNITVGNTAPTVNAASLSSVVYKNSSLNASTVCTDADSNNCAVTFRLWLNSVYQTSLTGTSMASGANTSILFVLASYSHFDNITIEAYGDDNNINSTYVNSSIIQIRDVVPSATLSWTPGSVSAGNTLNISSLYNDFDTDNSTIRFYIFKNGVQSVSLNRTGVSNNTNVSIVSSLSFVALDNLSYLMNATSLAESVQVTNSNLTVSGGFAIFGLQATNRYMSNTTLLNVTVNVTSISGNATIGRVFLSFNTTNYTMTNWTGNTFNFTFTNSNSFTEANHTINIWVENRGTGGDYLNETNSSLSDWIVMDYTSPAISSTVPTTALGSLRGQQFNLTISITDTNANFSYIEIQPPNGTVQYNLSTNIWNFTIEYNSTASDLLGNYTIRFCHKDLSNNRACASNWLGLGRINVSTTLIKLSNFTSSSVWDLSNATFNNNTGISAEGVYNITMLIDGILNNINTTVNVNLTSELLGNWSSINITNSTTSLITLAYLTTDNMTFSGENISSSVRSQTNNTMTITRDNNALMFSRFRVNDATERILVQSNFSQSFNVWLRYTLSSYMYFKTDGNHPEYRICVGVVTNSSGECSLWSTAVDVTTTNENNNSVSGYPVNLQALKASAGDENITEIQLQTNQSTFMIEVKIDTGSYIASLPPSGGSAITGGSTGVPPVLEVEIEPVLTNCLRVDKLGFTITPDAQSVSLNVSNACTKPIQIFVDADDNIKDTITFPTQNFILISKEKVLYPMIIRPTQTFYSGKVHFYISDKSENIDVTIAVVPHFLAQFGTFGEFAFNGLELNLDKMLKVLATSLSQNITLPVGWQVPKIGIVFGLLAFGMLWNFTKKEDQRWGTGKYLILATISVFGVGLFI